VSGFDVGGDSIYLGDAANANTLADLFAAGVIPDRVPEPGTVLMLASGLLGLGFVRRRI
jgi:PEP-CTERM motif